MDFQPITAQNDLRLFEEFYKLLMKLNHELQMSWKSKLLLS